MEIFILILRKIKALVEKRKRGNLICLSITQTLVDIFGKDRSTLRYKSPMGIFRRRE